MRYAVIMSILLLALIGLGEQFVYVRAGKVQSAPRDLPSVAVRLDTGETILGLHARDDATRAACGWYRVIPSVQKATTGQVVTGRSYTVGKYTVQEVLSYATRTTRTPQQRIAAALAAMPGATDDERVTALVRAVATTVTGTLDKAVTITVPANPLTPPVKPLEATR
jgi:hypothetical protein